MIADFTTAADRAGQLVDEVWSHIPTDLPSEQALRVAQTAFDILRTPTDAESLRLATLTIHLNLAAGLTCTIAFALLGLPALAWAGAACYALALVAYVLHVVAARE